MGLIIQIVAPGSYIEPLKGALKQTSEQKYRGKVKFSFCEEVDEASRLQRYSQAHAPDYVVIVMDPTNRRCIKMADESLKKLGPYLCAGRVCLVNGGCNINPTDTGVMLGSICFFAQKYCAILINGDVMIPDKCMNLVSRIMQLATSVCGFETGVPVVLDVPGCV